MKHINLFFVIYPYARDHLKKMIKINPFNVMQGPHIKMFIPKLMEVKITMVNENVIKIFDY